MIYTEPELDSTPNKKKCSCNSASVLKFMFSEGGLAIVILLYIVGGGLLFRAIESSGEREAVTATYKKALEIENIKQELIEYFTTKSIEWKSLNFSMVIAEYDNELKTKYQDVIADAVQNYSYDGTVRDPAVQAYGWELFSSWLFAATILTTIGYGHIAPVTEVGRLVTLLYAVIAVPIMSIFLLKIGHRVSKLVRLIYMSICCYPCRSRREKAHGRLMPHQKRQKVVPVDYLDEADEEEEGSIPNMLSLFIVFIYLMCGTFLFYMWQKGDNWNMVSSLYWGVVTLMTIGFGDMVPGVSSNQTTNGKMMVFVLIIYIIIGLTLVATVIDLAMKKAAKAAATVASKVAEKEEGDAKSINSNSTANTDALSAAGSKGSNKRRQPSRPISSISAADLDAHLDDVTPPPIVLA